ncbi:MAG: hemerythrin domain-containing protein [Rhizobiales bacterium]|nr:hemerythrin domain-containing protein [Hyphomicrobiales bacterium]
MTTDERKISRHDDALSGPVPLNLLDQPLDFILAEHHRHRIFCARLRQTAEIRQISRIDADRIVAYLTQDLDLHHADEDEDLFPALRKRAMPEDDLGAVLARLGEDHRRGAAMIEAIVDVLSHNPAAESVRIDAKTAEIMQVYAASEHRHLALENAVVLAIAGVRLHRGDLSKISRNMKARRGVVV